MNTIRTRDLLPAALLAALAASTFSLPAAELNSSNTPPGKMLVTV